MPHWEGRQQKQNMRVSSVKSKANHSKSRKNKENQPPPARWNNTQQAMSRILSTNPFSDIKYTLQRQSNDQFNRIYYQKQLQKMDVQPTYQHSKEKLQCFAILHLSIEQYNPQIRKQLFQVMKNLQSRHYSSNQYHLNELKIHQFSESNINNQHRHSKNEQDLQQLKTMLNQLEFMGFSSLQKKKKKLNDIVQRLLLNWDQFSSLHQPVFERFILLITTKIEFMPNSSIIYPTMSYIKRKLQHKISYAASKGKNKMDYRFDELCFKHYIETENRRNKGECFYFKDDRTEITFEQFNQVFKTYFEGNIFWKDIFITMNEHLSKDIITYDHEFNSKFVQNIPNITFPYQNCLGCSKFFYKNQNLIQPKLYKHMIDLLGSSKEIMTNGNQIKDKICAMLNTKGGVWGVLFLDCIKLFDCVYTNGRFVLQKEKEKISKQIISYAQEIYPKPQIGKDIIIQWAPIVQDPKEIKEISTTKDIKYVQGTYIGRIIVKSQFNHRAHFWTFDDKPVFSLYSNCFVPQCKEKIQGKNIHRFIKKFFNESKDLMPQEPKRIEDILCTMKHQCKNPQIGHQIENPHQIYKYIFGIVAQKSNHETIRKNFNQKGIQCVILTPFDKVELKDSICNAILYTNTSFEQLMNAVRDTNNYNFNGKSILISSITQYIRLIYQMSKISFDNLAKWLQDDYPTETLKMWRYQNERKEEEFYIQAGSKQSSLLIWIVMTQNLEKSSFQDPKGLEDMNEYKRNQKFKLLYTSEK